MRGMMNYTHKSKEALLHNLTPLFKTTKVKPDVQYPRSLSHPGGNPGANGWFP